MASAAGQTQLPSISRSVLHRRPVNPSTRRPAAPPPLVADVDPSPKPPAILQVLAFGFIVFLACLQFLPATHFRDPSDRLRNWIPFDRNGTVNSKNAEFEKIHVVSWTDCLDLRMLAVLVNSTLSSSRFPEHIYFHFFVPEGEDEKLSYYKLKVLLPHSNLTIVGQKEVKEKLRAAIPEWDLLGPSLSELAPLFIPIINPSLGRYIYVSSAIMMKGNIEDLFGVDLGMYALAAANDCSKQLGDYVNIDVLNAIQRTAAKVWVSDKPYDRNACMPDFNFLLFNAWKMDKNLVEAILWWTKVLNLKDERSNRIKTAVYLALYNKYLNLPSVWKIADSVTPEFYKETNILWYDGPSQVCPGTRQHQGIDTSNMWRHYLNPKSDAILTH